MKSSGRLQQPQRRARRVVAREQAGRFRPVLLLEVLQQHHDAEFLQVILRDRTRPHDDEARLWVSPVRS